MQNKRTLIGSLAVTLIIAGGWLVVSSLNTSKNQLKEAVVAPNPLAPNPKLESKYEEVVHGILAPFFDQKKVADIKEQLLEVAAPASYISVHLELVLAFDLIEQGQVKSDPALIEDGFSKIEKLTTQYHWLK